MLRIAYSDRGKISIENYDEQLHRGKIFCAQGHPLIAKRGNKIQHHYAHVAGFSDECSYSDGKTSWHMWWQNRIKIEFLEFRIQKEVLKIADAVNICDGKLKVIEFQNSVMKKEEISFREKFYSRDDLLFSLGVSKISSELFWVFNLETADFLVEGVFGDFLCCKLTKGSKYMFHAKATSFLDFGKSQLLQFLAIDKMETETPLIIGRVISLKTLDKFLFNGVLIEENLDQRGYRQPLISPETENFFETNFPIQNQNTLTDENLTFFVNKLKSLYFGKSTL